MQVLQVLQELRAQRVALQTEAETIMSAALEEKRPLKEDEAKRIDEINGTESDPGLIDILDNDIARWERHQSNQAALAKRMTAGRFDADGNIAAEVGKIKIPATARTHGQLHAFKSPEAAYASGKWLQSIFARDDETRANAKQFVRDHGILNVMYGNENASGGFLVPDVFAMPIVELREQYGVFRQNARVWPMSSDNDHAPRVLSELTVYFVGEQSDSTASDMSFGQVELSAREAAVLCRFSKNLNEDSLISVADILARSAASRLANKEDECGFNGDGTSTYGGMVGLKNALAAGSIVEAASGNTAFATLDLDDFESVIAKLPQYAGIMPKWYIHSAGWAASMLRLQMAAGGNTGADIAGAGSRMFMGYPVVFSQVLHSTLSASVSTIVAYFGDLTLAATFGDRRGITIDTTTERYFESRQIGVQFSQRFQINVHERGTASAAGPAIALKLAAS